jgi:hypothetical protein
MTRVLRIFWLLSLLSEASPADEFKAGTLALKLEWQLRINNNHAALDHRRPKMVALAKP